MIHIENINITINAQALSDESEIPPRTLDIELLTSLINNFIAEDLIRRQHARIAELDEQMTGYIKLLKRAPKITRGIYVGKDRQAWGVQAKAVLDAAIAAQAKQGE
jgi:hypothetical protein